MLTVIILDNGEESVVRFTFEHLYSELKDIPGSELIIAKDWFDALKEVDTNYVCLVEADCLVSKDYFKKQLNSLTKTHLRKISMLTAITAVSHWDNCFYGYRMGGAYTDAVIPVTYKKSQAMHPVQIGYMPGAIIRTKMLKQAIIDIAANATWKNDLVFLSAQLSFAFWRQGKDGIANKVQNGNPVYINPSVTYVTTEDYVNDIGQFEIEILDLMTKFNKESI